jgi:excisionase family DNA binding protein
MLREELIAVIKDCHLPQQNTTVTNQLLTIQEVAKYINMAVPSIYGLVHHKKIPHIKRGKRLIFEKAQINDWLRLGRRKTVNELQHDADVYITEHTNH